MTPKKVLPVLPARLTQQLRAAVTFFIFMFLLSLLQGDAYAHAMVITQKEEGVLRVTYDRDIPARRAQVKLLGSQGEVLYEGLVDSDGLFFYDSQLQPQLAEAEDGLGHLVHYDFYGESFLTRFPLGLRYFLGLVILGSVALLFRRKQNEEEIL